MPLSKRTLALLVTTALLAACGQGDDGASRDAEGEVAGNATNGVMADHGNPFARSELNMDRKMMAAVGVNAGDNWTAKMIEHHQGAVDMSRIVLGRNPTADVARLAQQTIDKQSREMEGLRAMRQQGSPDQRSAELYRPAMMAMHRAMAAATGADISQTYLRKMLEHHRGAVAMSDVALANGVSGDLKEAIGETRSDQQQEIAIIEAMLGGKSLDQAMKSVAVTPAPAVSTAPRPTAPARPSTREAEPRRAPPASKPRAASAPASGTTAAPKAPTPTCAPEHRAMGHC